MSVNDLFFPLIAAEQEAAGQASSILSKDVAALCSPNFDRLDREYSSVKNIAQC
jgi:aspartyl aminopeptidase